VDDVTRVATSAKGQGSGVTSSAEGRHVIDHREVVLRASLALDGSLPSEGAADLAEHVRSCVDCTRYVQQVATTSALVATSTARRRAESGVTAGQDLHVLSAVARASDPRHADDLVQETWDHLLGVSPGSVPTSEELLDYLLRHIDEHKHEESADGDTWADALVQRRQDHRADPDGLDLSPDPASQDSLRALADLDQLDADADHAELYFPDFYDDGPGRTNWSSPPTAWPTVTRILSPDAEVDTAELYSTVDAALDELPEEISEVVYLVDIEGHSIERAMSLLTLDRGAVQRNLVLGRNHLRGRISSYLSVV
jgi:DNA-directed RNA polymerase specialized sigma24 family protein